MNLEKKKTLGRQKIQMKRIESKSRLQVTFSKRRAGLFRKAGELSVLCGAEIALLVRSPAGKVLSFGSPSVESVLHRFHADGEIWAGGLEDSWRSDYAEAVRKLERERARAESIGEILWRDWERSWMGLGLEELEGVRDDIQTLSGEVSRRLDEMSRKKGEQGAHTTSFPATLPEPSLSFPENADGRLFLDDDDTTPSPEASLSFPEASLSFSFPDGIDSGVLAEDADSVELFLDDDNIPFPEASLSFPEASFSFSFPDGIDSGVWPEDADAESVVWTHFPDYISIP